MADDQLKYLEFLQATIARMASNSFVVKGWSVALGTAVLGFSVKDGNWALALIAMLPALAFWALDSYYLMLERQFRGLWVKALKPDATLFDMNPGELDPEEWLEAAQRHAVVLVHAPVLALSPLVALALWFFHSGAAH